MPAAALPFSLSIKYNDVQDGGHDDVQDGGHHA